MNTVWISLAVIGGVVLLVALARFAWRLRPQRDMSGMPVTPLERLGWVGLAVTTAVGGGLGILVAINGPDFQDSDLARGLFTLLILGGLVVWYLAWRVVRRRFGGAIIDERDRAIWARSLSVESVVVILSLVAWTVILTEVFWDEGAVPIAYLQLLFWSTFIGGAFGRSLGIVLGYRREIPIDA